MRSLWRDLALRWLGGEGSGALVAETSFLDRFAADPVPPVFQVRRIGRVSHAAMLHVSPLLMPAPSAD